MAAALTVRMEMLVAPAEPCSRQPDRVDAEGQRHGQPSQLERGACSRAKTDLIKIGELGDIRAALENEDRTTRAGKKDAVARFWRNCRETVEPDELLRERGVFARDLGQT
ncbi:hypothetical protein [Mesorhizobium sp. M0040]|uniref:hypothetical protein n=1 Tax=Mesorhizobium sp. M0040 TaxID=2956855 RepID=UPI003336427C